jgi:hypothetical protein
MKTSKNLFIAFFVTGLLLSFNGFAQSSTKQFSLDEIKQLLKNKVSNKELIRNISSGCVTFTLNTQITVDLAQSGATAELIELIGRNGCRSGLKITNPLNGSNVSDQGLISGTYDKSITEDIWVVIWPENAPGKGWPITDDAFQGLPSKKENGTWTNTNAQYGGPVQGYKIVVYSASPEASTFLSNKLREWNRSGNFAGLWRSQFPAGLVASDSIRVTKR